MIILDIEVFTIKIMTLESLFLLIYNMEKNDINIKIALIK